MTTRKPAQPKKAAAPKTDAPAPGNEVETGAAVEAAPTELVTVVAAKAFMSAGKWTQPGDEIEVTPDRAKDLARNGLIEGSQAEGGTPLGEPFDRTQTLTVSTGTAGDPTKEGED